MDVRYRALHTILGLKANPQEPTLAGEKIALDPETAAELLAAHAVEELAGDDLLQQADDLEAEVEKLRLQASQQKGEATQEDLSAQEEAEKIKEAAGHAMSQEDVCGIIESAQTAAALIILRAEVPAENTAVHLAIEKRLTELGQTA